MRQVKALQPLRLVLTGYPRHHVCLERGESSGSGNLEGCGRARGREAPHGISIHVTAYWLAFTEPTAVQLGDTFSLGGLCLLSLPSFLTTSGPESCGAQR